METASTSSLPAFSSKGRMSDAAPKEPSLPTSTAMAREDAGLRDYTEDDLSDLEHTPVLPFILPASISHREPMGNAKNELAGHGKASAGHDVEVDLADALLWASTYSGLAVNRNQVLTALDEHGVGNQRLTVHPIAFRHARFKVKNLAPATCQKVAETCADLMGMHLAPEWRTWREYQGEIFVRYPERHVTDGKYTRLGTAITWAAESHEVRRQRMSIEVSLVELGLDPQELVPVYRFVDGRWAPPCFSPVKWRRILSSMLQCDADAYEAWLQKQEQDSGLPF